MSRGDRVRWRQWLLAGLLILFIAAFARLLRLTFTNVGIVEFFSVLQPPGTPLSDYLIRANVMNPDHVPGYFLFTYALREVFGYHWLIPRYAAVVMSLVAMLLVAHFVARRFNPRTGFVVGILLALSPAGVYYGVQPRWYQLQILLVAISMVGLASAIERRNWRWAVTSIAANTLAAWTHPFAILFIGAQTVWLGGVSFLEEEGCDWRSRGAQAARVLGAWTVGHGLVWLLAIRWWARSTASTVEWYAPASPLQMLSDVFGDAFLHQNVFAYESTASGAGMSFAPLAMRGPRDHLLSMASDVVLIAITIAAFVSLTMQALRVRPWRNSRRARTLGLLVIVSFLPPFVLYAGAYLSFPMALPRYTAYCNVAYWSLVALGIANLPLRWARVLLVVALCGAFVAENAYWTRVNAKIRNDWRGMVRQFDEAPNPPERVLCTELNQDGGQCSQILKRMLAHYDIEHPGRYWQAYTLNGAVDLAVAQARSTPKDGAVYLVTYAKQEYPDIRARLVAGLEKAGFIVSSRRRGRFEVFDLRGQKLIDTWTLPPPDSAMAICRTWLPGVEVSIPPEELNAALRWTFEAGIPSAPDSDGADASEAIVQLALAAYEVSPKLASALLDLLPPDSPLTLAHVLCGRISPKRLTPPESFAVSMGNAYERELASLLSAGEEVAFRDRVRALRTVTGTLLPRAVLQRAGLEPRLPWAAPMPN